MINVTDSFHANLFSAQSRIINFFAADEILATKDKTSENIVSYKNTAKDAF